MSLVEEIEVLSRALDLAVEHIALRHHIEAGTSEAELASSKLVWRTQYIAEARRALIEKQVAEKGRCT